MTSRKADTAKRVWQLMFDYLIVTSPKRAESLARRNLTPNDARALWSLHETNGRPIGSLARDWGCDPSNATFIVDRLVRAGFAERRESETDRRVKEVRLTAAGCRIRKEILDEHHTPPEELKALSDSDLETLATIMEKLRIPQGPREI